jgi:hypothetical protein
MAHSTDSSGQNIFKGMARPGLRNVGSYQVSGHPYITGSVIGAGDQVKVTFPHVTKKVTVIASGSFAAGDSLRVHFASTGSGVGNVVDQLHYIHLNSHEDSFDFDVKCKEMYVSCPGAAQGFQLYASLTNISTGSMYHLTGAGITE